MCAGRAGKAKYDPKKHALVWKVKRYQGASEHALTATVELLATTRERRAWARPPIAMAFQARGCSQRMRWGGAGWGGACGHLSSLLASESRPQTRAWLERKDKDAPRGAVPRAPVLRLSPSVHLCAPTNALLSTSGGACAVL